MCELKEPAKTHLLVILWSLPSVNVSDRSLVAGFQIVGRERKIRRKNVKLAVSHKTNKFWQEDGRTLAAR